MRKGEGFGCISEWHRPFSRRVEGGEEEDEEGDHSEVSFTALRDVEAKSCRKESPRHLREGEKKQRPTSERVDGEETSPVKGKIDESESERHNESCMMRCTCVEEDRRRVKSLEASQ